MSAPLHIAVIMGRMDSGGVEAVVMNLCRRMDSEKIRFDFFLHADSHFPQREELDARGIAYTLIPPYSKPAAYVKTLTLALREGKYRIVHSHISTMSFLPLFAAWLAGVPVRICHNHSTDHPGEGKKSLLKRFLRPFARGMATDWFACGNTAARWMYGDAAVDAGRVKVLQNAVERSRYAFDPAARSGVRNELGLSEEIFVLGHIGRFTYAKNHEGLLEIFAALKQKRADAVLLLVGEGEREQEIREKVSAMGLTDSVRFLGVRRDADRLYSAFDAFCLPSFYEGLPVVGVELQWNGLPAVFSDEVTREALVNENVIALPLSAPAAEWADALLTLEREEPAADMEKFDIDRQAERLAAFYWSKV